VPARSNCEPARERGSEKTPSADHASSPLCVISDAILLSGRFEYFSCRRNDQLELAARWGKHLARIHALARGPEPIPGYHLGMIRLQAKPDGHRV
jgi:hypothetical protein